MLNRGPALVEPSVTNPSDPNYNLRWDFAEFSFNNNEIFANISHVDFVSLPISMTLLNGLGLIQHVSGMGINGLDMVCSGLRIQESRDHAGWEKLIIQHPSGSQLRALSPNSGIVTDPGLFSNYFEPYVDRVWGKFSNTDLRVNTQAQWGILTGRVQNGILIVGGQGFPRPTTRDIFSCSTGAFADNGSAERAAIIPRLAAAFNRSTLMIDADNLVPDTPSLFYLDSPTNHYSRIVHEASIDGKGYAFPYDDVTAPDQPNVAGTVQDSEPRLLTLAVGGDGAWMRARL
ncbi:glucanase b, partial [Aureobasidium melanogenum]